MDFSGNVVMYVINGVFVWCRIIGREVEFEWEGVVFSCEDLYIFVIIFWGKVNEYMYNLLFWFMVYYV